MNKKLSGLFFVALTVVFVLFTWWLRNATGRNPVQNFDQKQIVKRSGTGGSAGNFKRNSAEVSLPENSLSGEVVFRAFRSASEQELEGLSFSDLSNESLSLAVRRKLAWRLAQDSKAEDWAAIKAYLSSPDADVRVKAVMVEALGQSANPEARDWLVSAVDCGDDRIIRASLRGLAEMDDPCNVALFMNLLSSATVSPDVRAAAAEALGKLSAAEGGQYLIQVWDGGGPELQEIILQGLAHRNIAETEEFFGRILKESTDPELRLSVVESASQASGNAESFLLDCLSDSDSAVRAEAAWGLASRQGGGCAEKLMDCVKTEQDESVKGRLYEALGAQSDLDAGEVLALAQTEMNDAVRLSAYGAVIERFEDLSPADRETADQELSSELKWMAVNGETLNVRLMAVTDLQKIRTDRAEKVLQEIVAESHDPRVIQATGRLDSLLK
jgi:HEAT repeat protein